MNATLVPIWLRTCYAPGTDARHAAFLEASGGTGDDFEMELGRPGCVLDGAERYAFAHWSEVLSFTPLLLEDFNGLYGDRDIEWDSIDLQEHFFWMQEQPGETEERGRERACRGQRDFLVVDEEGMRTGWLLWVFVDQCGARREDLARLLGDDCGKEGHGNGLDGDHCMHCGEAVPEGRWTRPVGAADINPGGHCGFRAAGYVLTSLNRGTPEMNPNRAEKEFNWIE